jgi:uncharacterized coiled-coil protein SlyX
MVAKEGEERIGISAFLEEMISIIDARLKNQEKTIAAMQSELRRLRQELDEVSRSSGPKIDKSVLKILKQ